MSSLDTTEQLTMARMMVASLAKRDLSSLIRTYTRRIVHMKATAKKVMEIAIRVVDSEALYSMLLLYLGQGILQGLQVQDMRFSSMSWRV